MTRVADWLTCGAGISMAYPGNEQTLLLMSVLLGLMCIATGLSNMLSEQYCHTKRAELFETMNDLKLSDDMKAAEFFETVYDFN